MKENLILFIYGYSTIYNTRIFTYFASSMVNIAAIVAPAVVGGVCVLCLFCCCLLILIRCFWICCTYDQDSNDGGTELQYTAVPTDELSSYGVVYGAGQNDPPPSYNQSQYSQSFVPPNVFMHYDYTQPTYSTAPYGTYS